MLRKIPIVGNHLQPSKELTPRRGQRLLVWRRRHHFGNQSSCSRAVNDCTRSCASSCASGSQPSAIHVYQCDLFRRTLFRTPVSKGIQKLNLRGSQEDCRVPRNVIDADNGGGKIRSCPAISSLATGKGHSLHYEAYLYLRRADRVDRSAVRRRCSDCDRSAPETPATAACGVAGLLRANDDITALIPDDTGRLRRRNEGTDE